MENYKFTVHNSENLELKEGIDTLIPKVLVDSLQNSLSQLENYISSPAMFDKEINSIVFSLISDGKLKFDVSITPSQSGFNFWVEDAYEKYRYYMKVNTFESRWYKVEILDDKMSIKSRLYNIKEFCEQIKSNNEFANMWGFEINKRDLSLEERLDLASKTYDIFDPFDFGLPAKVDHDEIDKLYPVAKKLISINYKGRSEEIYE